jgi:hypothetical protein
VNFLTIKILDPEKIDFYLVIKVNRLLIGNS